MELTSLQEKVPRVNKTCDNFATWQASVQGSSRLSARRRSTELHKTHRNFLSTLLVRFCFRKKKPPTICLHKYMPSWKIYNKNTISVTLRLKLRNIHVQHPLARCTIITTAQVNVGILDSMSSKISIFHSMALIFIILNQEHVRQQKSGGKTLLDWRGYPIHTGRKPRSPWESRRTHKTLARASSH